MRIGIDLGGTKIAGIALGDDGETLWSERVPSPAGDYALLVEAIADLVGRAERATGRRGSIGIGIPGAVDPATGLVKNANTTVLIGKPFDRDMAARLARPVRLANDANCLIQSEASDGAARGAGLAFGVILGTGVGGGLAFNGQLREGPNAIAGEWGHNPLPWPANTELPGHSCYCGKRGCIETFLSGPALARDYAAASGRARTPPEIVAAAEASEAAAESALARYEDRLARALASVINIIDPDVIVLAGGLSQIPRLYAHVPLLWQRYVFSPHAPRTALAPALHGDASGVRGAAWLWPAAAQT
jgi:fructokinase